MIIRNFLLTAVALTWLAPALSAGEPTLVLKGKEGPGKGKHIVLVSGDEEYRTEESMPMLGKILSQRHGFDCTVLFAWDETNSYVDPNNQEGIKGWDALDKADLMIIGTRFRRPSAEDAKYVTDFLNKGKPVIGIRTATHAFNGEGNFGGKLSYGEFGLKILGEQWVSHHGGHKREGARGVIVEENRNHDILNSVSDVFGPSDVYGVVHLTDADTILMLGAVTETLDPKSKNVEGKKNNPMQPLAWMHPYTAPNGEAKGQSFCTTMGASVDLVNEDLRRLLVNASYALLQLDVPAKADVDYVDPFYPSFYGFVRDQDYWKTADLQAEDFDLGKTPHVPDSKGSPEWNFRDKP
ncbi:MAG: hypothetical protein ACI9R3_001001 [Verrucomicrobiales bacterium]|jgi:hypothetical protein